MKLYPYQERVKNLIRHGESVILQAPTGAGKTLAALSPFLDAFFDPASTFPHKCIYIVPMRVLAHQFEREYRERVKLYQNAHQREMRVTIQTGDQPDDPRFERGDLIFCTIDQFLSSFLTMPYSLPRRMANFNAGAMVGAYIVLDEFHLLDPGSTLPSTLYALQQLRRLAPILLMTATFSSTMLHTLAQMLEAKVELLSQSEAQQIENRILTPIPRQRIWNMADTPLLAKAVLDAHRTRSLALCNTVQNAQKLFRDLRYLVAERGLDTRLLLLHSRFLHDDRRKIEDSLQRLFGKEADRSGNVIAVATQTVEVGVDITSAILHTELAPASALIQRAGRCARYPGEQGQVWVYPVERYAPYGQEKQSGELESLWVKEMKAAHDWLSTHSGEVFDFDKEQDFVNEVAATRDRQALMNLSAGEASRVQAIHRVLRNDRRGDESRLLIRDADSRLVLIHSDPDSLLKNPYAATGFSLQTSTLYGMVKEWQERQLDLPWRVMRLVEKSDAANQPEDNLGAYQWEPLKGNDALASQVLVVHPALAGYLPEMGFVADQGNTGFESTLLPRAEERTFDRVSYRLESYEEHIRRVLAAFEELVQPALRYPAQALERAARSSGLDWLEGSVMRATWLVCLFHDVGKLNKRWQAWARTYQKLIGAPVEPGLAAAHTDREMGNAAHDAAEQAAQAKSPKPCHAGEGACATSVILNEALCRNEQLVRAALAAIARHHAPFAQEAEPYVLEPDAAMHIQATLRFLPEEIRQSVQLSRLKAEVSAKRALPLAEPDKMFSWLAYLLLVRALRRADQEGTAQGSREG